MSVAVVVLCFEVGDMEKLWLNVTKLTASEQRKNIPRHFQHEIIICQLKRCQLEPLTYFQSNRQDKFEDKLQDQ